MIGVPQYEGSFPAHLRGKASVSSQWALHCHAEPCGGSAGRGSDWSVDLMSHLLELGPGCGT